MTRALPLSKRLFLIAAIPLTFELTFLVILLFLVHNAEAARKAETHATHVIGQVNRCVGDVVTAGFSFIIFELTSAERPKSAISQAELLLARDTDELVKLVAHDDAELKEKVGAFVTTIKNSLTTLRLRDIDNLELSSDETNAVVRDRFKTAFASKQFMTETSFSPASIESMRHSAEIRKVNHRILQAAEAVTNHEMAVRERLSLEEITLRGHAQNLLKAGVALSFIISMALAFAFNHSIKRRLNRLTENTRRFAAGRDLLGAMKGTDEIARLDQSFHSMLSELRETRRREGVIINEAADIIMTIEYNGRIESINAASLKLLGIAADEVMGLRLPQLLADEDAPRVMSILDRATITGAESFEARARRYDGTTCETFWTVTHLASENVLACIVHDVSDRKRIERLKQQFSSMFRDDLAVPLNALSQSLAKVSKGQAAHLPERALNKLSTARKEIERLIALSNRLGEMEGFGRTTGSTARDYASLREIIATAVQALSALAFKRSIDIIVDCPSDAMFHCSRDDFTRVLINLLGNAVKFTNPKSPVTVSLRHNSEIVQLSVKDEGPGIPAHERERIFEKFKQVSPNDVGRRGAAKADMNNSTPVNDERKEASSGLGLAICKSIVEEHGGSITVVCPESGGSIFTINLPRTACLTGAGAGTEPGAGAGARRNPNTDSVEDDER